MECGSSVRIIRVDKLLSHVVYTVHYTRRFCVSAISLKRIHLY